MHYTQVVKNRKNRNAHYASRILIVNIFAAHAQGSKVGDAVCGLNLCGPGPTAKMSTMISKIYGHVAMLADSCDSEAACQNE